MARGLVYRIVAEGLRRGWWGLDPLSLIVDPFGGIGSTGIACSAAGLPSLSVELEPKFKELAEQNFALHEREWGLMGRPLPRVIQGDSRNLMTLVAEAIGGCVTSPPYAETALAGGPTRDGQGYTQGKRSLDDYGTTPGQLGAMPVGAITSPPYANRVDDSGTGPIAERNGTYGESDGQIGNLRLGAVTSPPYGDTEMGANGEGPGAAGNAAAAIGVGYGLSMGQIGQADHDTYWSACETIYRQLYDLFQPGSHLACVVKAFVKDKQLVDLPQMTLDLLVSLGFEPVTWVDAMLSTEHSQGSMLAEVPEYRRKRISFFRRLAEKRGSPVIDAEVVLVVRKL